MKRVMVRYQVKPDQAEKNEELVRAVYDELRQLQPTTMRYATFALDDGVSFIHVHYDETDAGARALTGLPAFKRFQEGVAERCDVGPVVSEMREVGSFRMFDHA